MTKKLLSLLFLAGAVTFLSGGEASAQTCTGGAGTGGNVVFTCESNTTGSKTLGFDPTVNLIPAVTNTNPDNGPCFSCPNSNAGGTTAGALTNSMFGEIFDNNHADLGDKSFNPGSQRMTIPNSADCGSNCNDSGAFTFSLPVPTQNFLSEGTTVASTNPTISESVGRAGVKIDFSNNFVYNEDGSNSFTQTVSQTTFTEGMNGNDLQIVEMSANASNQAQANPGSGGGEIFWNQKIEEGGFLFGPLSGSFLYNNSSFASASAPTGEGQTNGDNTNLP
ncbi:MAG: hypothetical protein ACE5F7_09675 [Nitrospiria bacterium]